MRILFFSPHSDPQAKLGEPDAGGQCVYEHELAKNLAEAGHEVITFCRQRNKHPAVSHVSPGYSIYRITTGGDAFVPKEDIARTIPEFTRAAIDIVEKRKRRHGPTIIHGHYWDGAMAALYFKANYRDYPMVWTPHSLGFAKRDKYSGISHESVHHFIPRLLWENYGTAIANRIICSTRDEKRKLVRYYNVLPSRAVIIPPGVGIGSAASADSYRRQWGVSLDTRIILCLGRMARTKGYQHAIRIMSRLQEKTDQRHVLVIVGGGTKISSEEETHYLRELKRLAKKLGVSDKVIFQPSVPHDKIQSIYSLADIYLMTAEEEPFGLTVIEAMAAGCVVIAHNRGGSKNIISRSTTGYVTDMHKYGDVADKIAQLLQYPNKMKKVGQRAREAVKHSYSWESRLPEFVKVYEDIAFPSYSRLGKILQTDQLLKENVKLPERVIRPQLERFGRFINLDMHSYPVVRT